MTRSPFLLRLCQRGAFTVFQTVFFFAVSFCRKRKAVCDHLPHEWAQAITHGRQTGKNRHPSAETGFNKRMPILPLGRFARFHASGCVFLHYGFSFLFGDGSFGVCFLLTRISFWDFFFNMPLLPFTSIFAPFSKPHQVVILVQGAKVISGLYGKARSSLLFSEKISSPVGSIFSRKTLHFRIPTL